MEEIVANVISFRFDIENALEQQLGAQPLPFTGMDKSGAAVCEFFIRGMCTKANSCPYRHVRGDKSVVCKHWLRGLCKKGDCCEFLHEFDMTKMPECYFYSKFNSCSNKECPFLHIDPETKIKNCPWYDRGFCRHGPSCRHRHVRRTICINYIGGFCLDGPSCKYLHPKFDLPIVDPGVQTKKGVLLCHYCQEPGHKVMNCPNMPPEMKDDSHPKPQQIITPIPQQGEKNLRPLDQVTCYKCGEKGHYANKCPKGHLAFLSNALQNSTNNNNNSL